MVEDLKDGRLVAERATWVRPVAEPTFRLSAVRKDFGLSADRYRGWDIMERRPPNMEPKERLRFALLMMRICR